MAFVIVVLSWQFRKQQVTLDLTPFYFLKSYCGRNRLKKAKNPIN